MVKLEEKKSQKARASSDLIIDYSMGFFPMKSIGEKPTLTSQVLLGDLWEKETPCDHVMVK